jgi:hypothetical protein
MFNEKKLKLKLISSYMDDLYSLNFNFKLVTNICLAPFAQFILVLETFWNFQNIDGKKKI